MFTIKIKTGNAAFQDAGDDGKSEVARILRDIADKLESGHEHGACVDANGNRVGEWSL